MLIKKQLINKLLEYPEINNNQYKLLLSKKNKIMEHTDCDINELNNINKQINLYNENQLLISMIKLPTIDF